MKPTALRILVLVAVLTAWSGCQSGPRFAWWKHDKAPEDTSAVARSAKPELPSAQSKPQAVAIAGLTPSASPSSTNLAAATGATASTPSAIASLPGAVPPSVAIPTSSSVALTNAPLANYSAENALADKIAATPNSKIAGAATPAAALSGQSAATVPAGGPYDPNAYKAAASLASTTTSGADSPGVDRYGLSTAALAPTTSQPADPIASTAPTSPVMTNSQTLANSPADRYGSSAAVTPAAAPLTDPAQVANDRYSNPTLPSMPDRIAQAPASVEPSAQVSSVSVASTAGQFRPGRTSSYISATAKSPIEVASLPPSPASTPTPAPASNAVPSAAPTTSSQPWNPGQPAPVTPAPTTRTY